MVKIQKDLNHCLVLLLTPQVNKISQIATKFFERDVANDLNVFSPPSYFMLLIIIKHNLFKLDKNSNQHHQNYVVWSQ